LPNLLERIKINYSASTQVVIIEATPSKCAIGLVVARKDNSLRVLERGTLSRHGQQEGFKLQEELVLAWVRLD